MRGSSIMMILAMLAAPAASLAGTESSVEAARANPIRKVVNMLQAMQKKVEAEGEKEKPFPSPPLLRPSSALLEACSLLCGWGWLVQPQLRIPCQPERLLVRPTWRGSS